MNAKNVRFRPLRVAAYALLAVAVIGGGWVLWRSVPFDLPSYATWAGVVVALVAVVSLLKPQCWLGIATRRRAAILLLVGVALTTTAALWPSSLHRSAREKHRIDDFLPEYNFVEYHEACTRAPLDRVIEATRNVSVADMPTARLLMTIRRMADGHLSVPPADHKPWINDVRDQKTGFMVLDESERDSVFALPLGTNASGMPAPVRCSPAEFAGFTGPGKVRVVFDVRVVQEDDGLVRVTTETRILADDPETRRVFARYWRFVYPGSAIIRRVWLDAMVARAERATLSKT